jgi:hypothetical protein
LRGLVGGKRKVEMGATRLCRRKKASASVVASMSNEFANRNPPGAFFLSRGVNQGARPRFSVYCRETQSTGGERRRKGATREESEA